MNRRLLATVGVGVALASLGALALVGADAVPLGREPSGCAPLAVSTPARTPGTDDFEFGQLVFADHLWEVRTGSGAPTTVGTWGRGQAEVRDDGALVLRQEHRDGGWHSAEVSSVHRGFGHGTYEWTIASALDDLDPAVVLGLFTFEQGAPGGREIDIEVARWGDPDADNVNYVSWFPDRLVRAWTNDTSGPTTHLFTWLPDRIVWCSQDADGNVLAWTSRHTALEPGDERVHMNLWIAQDTLPGQETEIVVTDFRFRPLVADPA